MDSSCSGILLDFSVILEAVLQWLSVLFLLTWTTVESIDRVGLLSSACLNPKVVFMLYLTYIIHIYIYMLLVCLVECSFSYKSHSCDISKRLKCFHSFFFACEVWFLVRAAALHLSLPQLLLCHLQPIKICIIISTIINQLVLHVVTLDRLVLCSSLYYNMQPSF